MPEFALAMARLDPRWRVALCVGPVIALALLIMVAVQSEGRGKPLDYLTIGMVFGTFFGQATLAAAWTALGPFPLLWRLPLALAWVAASAVALAINFSLYLGGEPEIVVIFGCTAFGQWLLAQVPLWGLAVGYGLRVRHAGEISPALDRQQRQFGIRQLMIVTAIVAVVLGIGRAIVIVIAPRVNLMDETMFLISFLTIAGIIMMLPLILAALLPRHAVVSLLVVLVLIGLATATELPLLTALTSTGPSAGTEIGHFCGINAFQCLSVLSVIGALRAAGYGLSTSSNLDGGGG